jgi:hypothetical protein
VNPPSLRFQRLRAHMHHSANRRISPTLPWAYRSSPPHALGQFHIFALGIQTFASTKLAWADTIFTSPSLWADTSFAMHKSFAINLHVPLRSGAEVDQSSALEFQIGPSQRTVRLKPPTARLIFSPRCYNLWVMASLYIGAKAKHASSVALFRENRASTH